jgi:hypothetical protein
MTWWVEIGADARSAAHRPRGDGAGTSGSLTHGSAGADTWLALASRYPVAVPVRTG